MSFILTGYLVLVNLWFTKLNLLTVKNNIGLFGDRDSFSLVLMFGVQAQVEARTFNDGFLFLDKQAFLIRKIN